VTDAQRLTIEPFHKFAPFVDDFRRRTDTSGRGAFDLALAVAMAASQMGYLSPNRPPASPLRHDDVLRWATMAATPSVAGCTNSHVQLEPIRYDTCRAVRADRAAGLMTDDLPRVMCLPCQQLIVHQSTS